MTFDRSRVCPNPMSLRLVTSAALLCGLILQCVNANAQSTVTAPDVMVTRARSSAEPLRVTTYIETGTRRQYATAHVTIKNPKGPSPNDRNLFITLHLSSIGIGVEGFSTSQVVQLAEGQTQVDLEIPFVNSGVQCYWDVEIFEDGRSIEDDKAKTPNQIDFQYDETAMQISYFGVLQGTNEPFAEVKSNVDLLVGNASLSLAPSTQMPTTAFIATAGSRTVRGSGGSRIVPTKEASEDWRQYFTYQSWFVSLPTLRECVESRPAVAKALREYVAAGGSVILHGVDSTDELGIIDSWLQREDAKSNWQLSTSSASQLGRFLEPPDPSEDGLSGTEQSESSPKESEQDTSSETATLKQIYAMNSKNSLSASSMSEAFENGVSIRTRHIEGLVLCINTKNPQFAGQLSSTFSPTYNSVTPQYDGNWFWRNLITSVGKPPVWAFTALVGLFGLILGPGLLLSTGMIGRRSLMIFCVPVVATVATLFIIGYSILYEGFDNHIRVISQTRFDVSNGSGFAWSRQNYFCGSTPRDGISFSQNAYVRPAMMVQLQRYTFENPKRTSKYKIINTDQQIWRGWLKPRQQQQAFVGHPIEGMQSPVRISNTEGGKTSAALKIENTSAWKLPFVVVHGTGDEYFFCEELAPGESQVCEVVPEKEAGAYIQMAMVDLRPTVPVGMEEGGTLFRNFTSSSEVRSVGNDTINRALTNYLSDKLRMPNYSFATILPENDFIEVPLEGERSEDLHIIIGEGQW